MCSILLCVIWSPLSVLLSSENWISILTLEWKCTRILFPSDGIWRSVERREAVTVTDESSFLLLAAVLSLYYTRWQCCHVPGMYPVFPAERSRMLLMLIGSFSQQAPPCAPANNKRPRCLLRLINQTNATGGTKHVCKCTWAFLTCLPVYMEGGSGGFMHLCVCDWGQTSCMELPANGPSELYDRILLLIGQLGLLCLFLLQVSRAGSWSDVVQVEESIFSFNPFLNSQVSGTPSER